MHQHDLNNLDVHGASLSHDDLTASQNGVGVDFLNAGPEVIAVACVGTNPGDDTTIIVTLEESADDVTYAAITGATMDTISGDTERVSAVMTIHNRRQRYVRAVATLAGTSEAVGVMSVVLMGQKIHFDPSN